MSEAAVAIGVPPELVAVPLLTYADAAIGNRHVLELKRGYTRRAISWSCVVASPGAAKTPADTVARKPLTVLQREAKDRFDGEMADYEEELQLWNDAKKGERGPKPTPPALEHFYTTDSTKEALAKMHRGLPPRTPTLS